MSDLKVDAVIISVTPFISYEGLSYNATSSEIAVSLPEAISSTPLQ